MLACELVLRPIETAAPRRHLRTVSPQLTNPACQQINLIKESIIGIKLRLPRLSPRRINLPLHEEQIREGEIR